VRPAVGQVIRGDSRDSAVLARITKPVDWVITSPPYYGMRTYLPDQWLRLWFLGGLAEVEYSNHNQVAHSSTQQFEAELRQVWKNLWKICSPKANLIVRFGSINDRPVDPLSIIENSITDSGWQIKA